MTGVHGCGSKLTIQQCASVRRELQKRQEPITHALWTAFSQLSTSVRLEAMDELERENMELRRSLGGAETEADELRNEVKRAQAQAESATRQRDSLQRELHVLRQQVQDVEAESRAKMLSLQTPVRNDEAKE